MAIVFGLLNNICSTLLWVSDCDGDPTVQHRMWNCLNSPVPVSGWLYFMCGRFSSECKNTVLWQQKLQWQTNLSLAY